VLVFDNFNILNNNQSILVQFVNNIEETIDIMKAAAEQSQTVTSSANTASTVTVATVNGLQSISAGSAAIGGF
jgi:hypothetical protein